MASTTIHEATVITEPIRPTRGQRIPCQRSCGGSQSSRALTRVRSPAQNSTSTSASSASSASASVAEALALLALLALVLVLFCAGLLTLVSALEDWDPPHDRWQGIRWPRVGLIGSVITVASWIVVLAMGRLS